MNIEQLTKVQQELNAANERIVELEEFLRRYMYRVEMRGREPISVVERLINKDWKNEQ